MRLTLIFLISIFFLSFIVRIANWDMVFRDETVFLGADPYYHVRRSLLTYINWPSANFFDSYLNYPHGHKILWPPLFDQLISGIALLTGNIEATAALLPPIIGGMTAVVIYFITLRIFDRKVAIISSTAFAFMPAHIYKSRLGFADHHSAEVLFLCLSILFLLSAVDSKRKIHFLIAGFFLSALSLLWIGAPLYSGIFLIYFFIARKENFPGSLIFFSFPTITTLLAFLAGWVPFFSFGFFLILLSFCFLFFGVRQIVEKKKLPSYSYPLSVGGIILSGFLFIQLISPPLYATFLHGITYLFRGGPLLIVAEALPLFSPEYDALGFILARFTTTFFVALATTSVYIPLKMIRGIKEEELLFLVWTIAAFALSFLQIRFIYLLGVNVSILIGYAFVRFYEWSIQPEERRRRKEVTRKSKIVSLTFLFLFLLLPNTFQSVEVARAKPTISEDWLDALKWLRDNTEETSYYLQPDKKPEYSVLSWWDYGNWIVWFGKRPVVANNFQTGIYPAANFLTSESEKEANSILEKHRVRYIILDFRMGYGYKVRNASGIFGAISSFAKRDGYFYSFTIPSPEKMNETFLSERYYNTIYSKLFFKDGSDLGSYALVYESENRAVENFSYVKIFKYVKGALISGSSLPGQKIEASTSVTTNRGREFIYRVSSLADENGKYEMRVAYPGIYKVGNISIEIKIDQIENGSVVNLGVTEGKEGIPLKKEWELGMDSPILFLEDSLYIASQKKIYCVDGGEIRWEVELGEEITSLFVSDRIYATSADEIFAIKNGSILWRSLGGKEPWSKIHPLVVDNGKEIYVGKGRKIFAIEKESGRILWEFEGDSTLIPFGWKDSIYAVSYQGTLYAIRDGESLWEKNLGGKVWGFPVLADKIYLPFRSEKEKNGMIYGIGLDGKKIWEFKTSYYTDHLSYHNQTLYASSYDGTLYMIDKKGNLLWKYELFTPLSPPLAVEDGVIVGGHNSFLYKISGGELKWEEKLDSPVRMIAGSDQFYVASMKKVYAFTEI